MSSLIAFRVVQGTAAGLMMTLGTRIITQAAGPSRMGRAAAIASLLVVVVPVFGPVIGGLIISHLAWRWIFYVNVPVCLAALGLAWRGLTASAPAQRRPPLDVLGLALLPPGLGLIIYGLSQAAGPHGFASTQAWLPLTAGLACTGAFVAHALHKRERALVDLRVLRVRSFAAGADSVGARPVVLTGLVLTSLGTLPFAWAGPAASPWLLAGALFVRGAGLSAVTIAVIAGAFKPGAAPLSLVSRSASGAARSRSTPPPGRCRRRSAGPSSRSARGTAG
jgi:Major Facilitator Superfamily